MAFQGETTQIVKPKLLLCEVKEDARFFRAFLNHLAIVDFQVEDVEGKTNFRVVLSALVKRPDFATVASLGICRDADDQPLGAFQSLQIKRRGGWLLGRFFAVTREQLRTVAKQCGVHHLANLGGCPAG